MDQDFWNEKLAEYQEALEAEQQMEDKEHSMIEYLKFSIEECLRQLS